MQADPEPAGRRGRGDLEHEALAVLSAAARPQTVEEVRAALVGTAAYTTVMTTLARLHRNGVLTRVRTGRAYRYRLATAPESVTAVLAARRMRRLLDSEGDRADVLARFVAGLDPADEALLATLVTESDSEREPGSDVDLPAQPTGRDAP